MIFGLPFLKFEEVYESFVFDINLDQETPDDPRVDRFLQYLLTTYMTSGSTFPPHLWASDDLERKRTTNGCEAFHRVFYSYASHYPSSTPLLPIPHTHARTLPLHYFCLPFPTNTPFPTSTFILPLLQFYPYSYPTLPLPLSHFLPLPHYYPCSNPILLLPLPHFSILLLPLIFSA